jgi:hypothetical protein
MTATQSGDWVLKESRSHPGAFYKYNTKSGTTEWLGAGDSQKQATVTNNKKSVGPQNKADTIDHFKSLDTYNSSGLSPTKGTGRRPLTRSSRPGTAVSWGTDDTSTGSECVCTICECGKHHCPLHGNVKPSPFDGNSRYREDYPAHPLKPRDRPKLARAAQSAPADPDQFKSKYTEDFIAHGTAPAKSMKPKSSVPFSGPFEGTTTNRAEHGPKPMTNKAARRPPSPPKLSAPFEGTTTNRDLHRPFPEAKPRDSMAPSQRKMVTAPFDGLTQYKQDYPPRDVSANAKQPQQHAPYEYGPPRDLQTENRSAFIPKPIQYCPVLDLDPRDPSGHTGHIHYTKKQQPDFRYHPGKPFEHTHNPGLLNSFSPSSP